MVLTTTQARWPKAWRIIASRFPPIDLFERVSDNPAMSEVLADLEQATNPRVRDEIGEIALVPPNRRVAGPGASWVMAPFTHVNPKGSRFSNGSYGVYYAAYALETALRETIYHFEKFARDARDPPRREDMRVLVGRVFNTFDDVNSLSNSGTHCSPRSKLLCCEPTVRTKTTRGRQPWNFVSQRQASWRPLHRSFLAGCRGLSRSGTPSSIRMGWKKRKTLLRFQQRDMVRGVRQRGRSSPLMSPRLTPPRSPR